jgi:hypothetical protein
MVDLNRFRPRLMGLGLFLGVILLASAGIASGAALSSAHDHVAVGEPAVQNLLPAVAGATPVRQAAAASSTLSTTLSSTIFLPIVYRDYRAPLPPLCRYGVAAWGEQLKWLPTWRAGWTLDFSAHAPSSNVTAEFAQVIRVRQQKDGCTYLDGYKTTPALTEAGLGAIIRRAPGAVWIVGNEPDRGPNPESCQIGVQDDTYPEIYVRAYHDVYHFIKQRDPSAQVANAGLVQVTPGRLQYLDKMWQEYQVRYGAPMPVDIWNMHLYILPEVTAEGQPNGIANIAVGTDPGLGIRESGGDPNRCSDPQVYCYAEHDDMAIFAEQVVAMRIWMKQKGQQNKPLILSEYSLLYPYDIDPEGCFVQDEYGNCFTPERVSAFMKSSFAYLEGAIDPALGYPLDGNRLVQRWMWFSANYAGAGRASSLLENTLDRQTLVGETLESQVASKVSYVNLLLGHIERTIGHTGGPGRTATVALSVEVFNNGSVANATPVKVTFYADRDLTQVIGTQIASATINGCASEASRLYMIWSGLSAGMHTFWVKVDSDNAVGEIDEADNIGEGVVFVYEHGVYLPLVTR